MSTAKKLTWSNWLMGFKQTLSRRSPSRKQLRIHWPIVSLLVTPVKWCNKRKAHKNEQDKVEMTRKDFRTSSHSLRKRIHFRWSILRKVCSLKVCETRPSHPRTAAPDSVKQLWATHLTRSSLHRKVQSVEKWNNRLISTHTSRNSFSKLEVNVQLPDQSKASHASWVIWQILVA